MATAAFDNNGVEAAGKPSTTASDGASVARFKQLSAADGTKKSPPNSAKGTMVTDSRPADDRTQRVTKTPAMNKNKPATTTKVEPPVAGNEHTSTANITELSQIIRQHNLSLGD